MQRVVFGVVVVALSGCLDTVLPSPPGPGSLSGRVLVAAAGEPVGQPVAGATITLVEAGLSATTSDDGRFVLSPITQREGTVEISAGALKRVFSLQALGGGFGRSVALGDVALSRNASVQGEVLLEDGAALGGTLVFLEGQPHSTFTTPSGQFVLRELPVGPVTLSIFRAGYTPYRLPLELRSGERTFVDAVTLRAQPLVAAEVHGRATLDGLDDARGITVSTGADEAAVDASGAYRFSALTPGVHSFTFRAAGRSPVVLANRLIAAAVVELPPVTLSSGEAKPVVVEPFPAYDAGVGATGGGSATGGGDGSTGGGSATGGGDGSTGGGSATGGGDASTGGGSGAEEDAGYVATRVSAGAWHTCAVLADKRAYCWGRDTFGQVSGPPGADSIAPTLVAVDVSDIGAGSTHTCVVHTDAGVECWGANDQRQLGVATPNASGRGYPSIPAARSISAGQSFTATVSGPQVWCWGVGSSVCGSGVATQNPYAMQNITVAEQVSAGGQAACVVMEVSGSPSVTCTGSGAPPSTPILRDVRHVSSGSQHSCAAKFDGGVSCWGSNTSGQLGTDGGTAPAMVPGVADVVAVAAGGQHSCALHGEGALTCWGGNLFGQLGDGTFAGGVAQVTPNLTGVTSVSAGGGHTCAVRAGGALWCWGNNEYGQLGVDAGASSNVPVRVELQP